MTRQQAITYNRIEKAIHYITQNFAAQPSLEDVAAAVNLSPYHFQRVFTEWAGVSPKKFMQYLSLEYAKGLLRQQNTSLLEASFETGLSGPSRLHDLFVNIEGMTPGMFKSGGAGLAIRYAFAESPFGKLLVASTPKGVCHMAFVTDEAQALADLAQRFPQAALWPEADDLQAAALGIFQQDWQDLRQIRLHLAGTPFQLKVWETLLRIPMGQLTTYGEVASFIGKPQAHRAVGTAIGRNPIAFLIPCHRVIQSSGKLGGYMWGLDRKSALIGWEAAQVQHG